MSSESDFDLPSSEKLEEAGEAEDEKRGKDSSDSSESEKENEKRRGYRGILGEVRETKEELKYRSKNFKDKTVQVTSKELIQNNENVTYPDDVITSRKLRCTVCNTFLQSVLLEGRDIYQHPILKVLMCKGCLEFYGSGDLSIDEDGTGKYCRWCAQGGTLYCCAACCNAFCKKCIKRNLNRSVLGDIELEEWNCFVCDGEPLWELRAICKNTYIVSKKIKRKRKEEYERNLKQLQKKRKKLPTKRNSRQLNKWQKSASRHSSSSSDDDSDENQCSKSKKSKKRKRANSSTGSDGGKPDTKKKEQNLDSDVAIIESEKECIVLDDDKPKNCEDNCKQDELPNQLDSQSTKEAVEILTEHLTDLIHTGELIAYRAKRLVDKKLSEDDMSDPKKVDKVMSSVNLLVKLSNQNMQHTVQFLNSQHKHWVKNVTKRTQIVKEKQGEISDIVSQDIKVKDAMVNGIINGIESVEDKESLENGTSICENTVEQGNENTEADRHKKVDVKHKRKSREEDNGSEVAEGSDNDNETRRTEKQAKKKSKTMHESESVKVESEVVEVKKMKENDITTSKDEDFNKIDQDLESITSLSTVKIGHNDSQVDMFVDSSFQENISTKDSDNKQSISKDIDILEKSVEKADSGDDAATIELLCSEGSDKDGETVRSLIECDSVAGVESDNHKKQDEVNEAVLANVGEEHDPLALNECDLEITEEKSRRNEDDTPTVSDLEKKTDKPEDSDGDNDSASEALSMGSKPEECEDEEEIEKNSKEEKKMENYTDDCFNAQDALLGYTSDDEDDEKCKKKRKKKDKTKILKEVQEKEDNLDTKIKNKRRIGPKSKTRQFRSSSSSSAADAESDSSGITITKRGEDAKKRKFKLHDTEAYKNDKKLGWTCIVDIEKLVDKQFQKYYENYYSPEDEVEDYKEIERLTDLKSLKKVRSKRTEEESSDESSDESEKSRKRRKQRREKKKEKDREQSLIDIFNEDADGSDAASDGVSDQSGSENRIAKRSKKKSIVDTTNEMAMKMLLESSCDDISDELNEDEENEPKDKKKNQKPKENMESNSDKDDMADVSENDNVDVEKENFEDKNSDDKSDVNEEKEEMEVDKNSDDKSDVNEEKEEMEVDKNSDDKSDVNEEKELDKNSDDKSDVNEVKEEMEVNVKEENSEGNREKKDDDDDADKEKDSSKNKKDDDSNDSDKSEKPKKKNWRQDKLLNERLTDLDTSDEERLWNKRKQREKKAEDSESDLKRKYKKKLSKEKVKRRILDSDDENEVFKVPSTSSESESTKNSSDDSDIFVIKKKKKKKAKKSDSDNTDSSSDFKTKKPKRRRIKAPASDSSSNEDEDGGTQKSGTPGKGRKKIHHIMSDDNVAETTRKAAKEEEERRKRIAEKQKLYNEIYNEVPDEEKVDKLVLDFDPETKKELVSVDPNLVSKLKPHQAQGIKFMWDACFESLERIKNTKGSGCILAHCMGLGKTFQIVSLVHTLLNHKKTQVKTVLVICPLTTVLNWCNEFNKWLKDGEVNVFELTRYKLNYERQYRLKEWMECGGVMVLGYQMYRTLTNPQAKRVRKKDIDTFQRTLVDPGPDLIVCDEGHVLKNEDTAIAKALRRVKTLRRIVLTGTPLQNNLKEYHCMVQFVKPSLLGTRKEFLNRFVNPISNGQFEDSTLHDVKIMKRRAHVLHKMLEGSVQRFDYSVLTPFLPPKHEYVVFIRLHEVQVKAYRHYMDFFARRAENNKGAQLFSDFNNLQRIWTHPRVLQMSADKDEKIAERKQLLESESEGSLKDFIDDDDVTTESSGGSSADSSKEDSDVQVVSSTSKDKSTKHTRNTRSKGPVEEHKDVDIVEKENKEALPPWWKQFMQGDELENINYSGKLVLLFSILKECEKIGDKILIFSQSLLSLDLIEYFLAQIDLATQNGESKEELGNHTGSWSLGLDYFRIDGSASSENRHIWCKSFNREDNHRARLFLISTKAGGLGINLFGANRVIIFDASWNPSHDVQSIFRIYRFGQKKPCYVYRFLAQGTMEEKVYDRQVTKLSLSCRVVDEQQIERHYNMADLQELYRFDPEQKTKRPTPILPKDRLLAELLKEQEQWIETYHEHDSLLENKEEEELNEDERKAAWEEYENEKQGKVITSNQPVGPNLNMQALREALRNENPQATNEELELKVATIVGQIYDYLRNQQNTSVQQKYTAAQLQALQQYQLQQQQMRAQREKQMQMQQDLSFRTAAKAIAGFNQGTNVSFQQYLQNQKNTNVNNPAGSNLYRNPNLDQSGLLRMQSKLVPFHPKLQGPSRVMVKNFGMSDMGPNVLTGRQPVILPQSSMQQIPSSVSKTLVKETKEKDTTKKSVPDDVIETIE